MKHQGDRMPSPMAEAREVRWPTDEIQRTRRMHQASDAPTTGNARTPLRRLSDYEAFLREAWTASREVAGREPWSAGAILVAALRRALECVPPWTFNQHLLRMERNAVIYLVPALSSLTVCDSSDGVAHPDGRLRLCVLWMRPRTQAPIVWD